MSIPAAQSLPEHAASLVRAAALAWRDSPARPHPAHAVLDHWDELIDRWIANPSAPLLVRKGGPRGAPQRHRSGRIVVAVDNSPAHWAMASALLGRCPSLEEALSELRNGDLPIAFALDAAEARIADRYTGLLGRSPAGRHLNKGGWKVCHIDDVGIGARVSVTDLDEAVLDRHFSSLMRPRNMFLVPTTHAGFGELPEVVAAFR